MEHIQTSAVRRLHSENRLVIIRLCAVRPKFTKTEESFRILRFHFNEDTARSGRLRYVCHTVGTKDQTVLEKYASK